jgi:hypothetical protein
MKNTERGAIAAIALLIVVGAMFVTGGVYVYSKYKEDAAERDLIFSVRSAIRAAEPTERAIQISADLAWAKARLQMETDKLNQLKAEAGLAVDMSAVLKDAYTKVDTAFSVKTAQIKIADEQLAFKREQIGQILNNWENLLANPTPENTRKLREALRVELPQVQLYFNSLSTAVNSLTPANSGLTQTQINTYQTAVTEATTQVTTAVTSVTNAETQAQTSTSTSGSGSSGNTSSNNTSDSNNTGNDTDDETTVEEQEEIVDEIEDLIEDLEEEQTQVETEIQNQSNGTTGTSTNSGGNTGTNPGSQGTSSNTGTTYIPPTQNTNTDGPQLIEGINQQ